MKNLEPRSTAVAPLIKEDPNRVWPATADMCLSTWLRERNALSRDWVQNPEFDAETGTFIAHPETLTNEDIRALGKMTGGSPWQRAYDVRITVEDNRFRIAATPNPDPRK